MRSKLIVSVFSILVVAGSQMLGSARAQAQSAGSWLQWGRTAQHNENSPVVGQSPQAQLAESGFGLQGWEPVFHAAISGGHVFVPGASGSVYELNEADGTVAAHFTPFGSDPNTYVSGPLTTDASGNIYYNAMALDPTRPWTTDVTGAWLVKVAPAGNVVHYTATNANVKYLFATAEPVARLKSGDILDTNTLDCFGNVLRKPGDTLSMVKGDNPLTGPFFVEGAEPGDTLAVKILELDVDGDTGVGAFAPGFGALNETNYTPMLHAPLPERIWYYHIDHATNTATFKAIDTDFSVKIPLHPFFGCIGVAPAEGEARSSVVPAEFGGNMDSPEASVGNTVYFPVNVKGGLFYIGDGHAAMGDGEIAGTAIEVPLKARVQLSVIKGRTIAWPQFENDDAIMTVGAYRPLDDALRIAFTELVHWIHKDYGLSELDAYELLSKVAKIHLNEMVDPNYVVVASIEKKYLPKKK